MRCPACLIELQQTKTSAGMVFHCPQCDGQAVAMAVLRRLGSKEAVQRLWNLTKDARPGGDKCPACDGRMVEAALPVGGASPLCLDVCTACQFVWLAPGECNKFPAAEPEPPKKELSDAARQAVALRRAQIVADQAEREERAEQAGRAHPWHALAHLIQIPLK
jgi:Zn-finger nucleic acid-binding protein